MNVEDVRRKVQTIRGYVGDDEAAHSEEDALHQSVLRSIAVGECDDPAACAAEALLTREIEFSRWYA